MLKKKYTHSYILILFLFVISCKSKFHIVSQNEKLFKISSENINDTLNSAYQFLKPYKDSISKIMSQEIGIALGDFKKEKPQSSLGNLIVDAMYDKAKELNFKIDNVIYNYGGVRIPEIKKGNITMGKIFELLPFENELVLVEVNGYQLKQWMTLIDNNGGWPTFYKNTTQDTIIVNTITKDSLWTKQEVHTSKSIQDSTIYHIVTNDYIANGGDNCYFLKDTEKKFSGLLIRDIVIHYIQKNKNVTPSIYSQITINK